MKFFSSVYDLIIKAMESMLTFWNECTDTEKIVAENNLKIAQQQRRVMMTATCMPDYERVANALRDFLVSNHNSCGLTCPKQIEDVFSLDPNLRIRESVEGAIVFSYSIDRLRSDMLLGGMKRVELPKVDVGIIADTLNRRFPLFAERRGYRYSYPIIVDDIAGEQVRITIVGIWREDIIL